MQYVLIVTFIASASTALAAPPTDPEPREPLRVQPRSQTAPEQAQGSPAQQQAPRPTSMPRAIPQADPVTAGSPSAPAPESTTESDQPEKPGWTGIVFGVAGGSMTPAPMSTARRDLFTLGIEVRWERPRGELRPAVLLRNDVVVIFGTEPTMSGQVSTVSRPRFDLGPMVSLSYGPSVYGRVAFGAIGAYGIEGFRTGVLAEASLGWRRVLALYGEWRKTWGDDNTDVGLSLGLRLDLSLLGRLN